MSRPHCHLMSLSDSCHTYSSGSEATDITPIPEEPILDDLEP
jgi:hypothetical protein